MSERRRHSEKPLLHKDIERLVDGPYIEMFARKNTMKIGTIGKMKYDILTLAILYSIIPLLLVCLLLWMWNEDPK